MFLEGVQEAANAIVPQLDRARVQRGQEPRPRRMKAHACKAATVSATKREKKTGTGHVPFTRLDSVSNLVQKVLMLSPSAPPRLAAKSRVTNRENHARVRVVH